MSYIRDGISLTSDSYPYVTGNGFRNRAHMIFDEHQQDDPSKITEDNQVIFIKTDFVSHFFTNVLPEIDYKVKIITHNSALGIDFGYLQFLDNRKVTSWHAQNANILHYKLNSIPLGVANKRWAHGNIDIIEEVSTSDENKENLAYMNFDISTNSNTRSEVHNLFSDQSYVYCAPKKSFGEYLKDLKSSKFCISPQGRGVDCHRIWESILMRTIPIVKDCQNISFYRDMPILIIDDWAQIDEKFLEEEYENKINKWDDSKLFMDHWIKEIGLKS
tara:strand:- start:3923 stop:4744 length:822 start_codon:yes stop_codon:yes gene_type:complete